MTERSWEGMSMGAGRKIDSMNDCPGCKEKAPSPDGKHHYTAISCVG